MSSLALRDTKVFISIGTKSSEEVPPMKYAALCQEARSAPQLKASTMLKTLRTRTSPQADAPALS